MSGTLSTLIATAQTAASAPNAMTAGSADAAALTLAVAAAEAGASTALASATAALAPIVAGAAPTSSVFPPGVASVGVANLNAAIGAASQLASLPVVIGLLGRIQTNLANAST